MHNLHTVYNTINDHPPSTFTLIFSCLFFVLLAYGTFTIYRGIGKNVTSTLRGGGKVNSFLIIILAEVVLFVIFLISDISTINLYQHDKDIYNSSQLKVVEGYVTDYYPMPAEGHANESFKVNGVGFAFSDYEAGIGGYHNAASHGGVIRPNLYVRIGYYDDDGFRNVILRLETE